MEKLTKAERKEQRKLERQDWEKRMDQEEKRKVYKKASIWILAAAVIILAIWGLISLVNTSSTPTTSIKMPPLNSNDISTGPANSKVVLLEYADFQCPTCGLYHPILKQLLADFNGKIRFVYRFFPIPTIHQNALPSARAAYAAYLQGKFWEMHDMLFEHQQDWATKTNPMDIYITYAKNLNLDIDKFKKDYAADSTLKFIEDEENTGANAGVIGTPTFFINGKQIENPQGYQPFKQLINDQLKK